MIVTKSLFAADRGAHLLSLSKDDRRLRFGTVASDTTIRNYVDHIDFDRLNHS